MGLWGGDCNKRAGGVVVAACVWFIDVFLVRFPPSVPPKGGKVPPIASGL